MFLTSQVARRFAAAAILLALFGILPLVTHAQKSKPALLMDIPRRFWDYYDHSSSQKLGTGGATFGDPIDAATGAFVVSEQLAHIPGRVPITLSWMQSGQDASNGPLGIGTSFSTDYFLSPHLDGGYWLTGPGNRRFRFTTQDWVTYTNATDPEVLGATLQFHDEMTDRSGYLRFKGGSKFHFSAEGALNKIEDRHGNYVTIARNSNGYPTLISQQDGRSVSLTYNPAGKVSTVTLPLNRVWQFSYDGSGRIYQVRDLAGNYTTYQWFGVTRPDGKTITMVSRILDRSSRPRVTNTFDGEGKVTRQELGDGGVITPTYYAGYTRVVDARNNATEYHFTWNPDAGYNITYTVDANGRGTTFERTGTSYLVTGIVDHRSRRITLGWDHNRGNLISLTTPTAGGGFSTWTAAFESTFSQPTTITDPMSRQTVYTVDSATGNVTAIRNPRNFTTSIGYAANGDPTSVTNALNQVTTLGYAGNGDLLTITGPAPRNLQSTFTYDAASRLLTARDANLKTVWRGWTPMDQVASITQSLGVVNLVTLFEYDAEGNLKALVDPKNQRWEWSYDVMDRVIEAKDPLLRVCSYTWDKNSNLLSWADQKGQRAEYIYGVGDRLSSVAFKRLDGTTESTKTCSYSPTTDLLESVNDSAGGVLSWTYNAIDRVVSETGPEGTVTLTLDDLDRRTSLQVPGQGLVTYGFDNNDNVTSITQNGSAVTLAFDALDRVTSQLYPNGIRSEWSYTADGFLSSLVAKRAGVAFDTRTYSVGGAGNITQEVANGFTSTFGYDDLYSMTSASVGGVNYSWSYDNVGNRLSQTAGGPTTNYSFDASNRLTAVNGATVTHDAVGNLTAFGNDSYSWDVRGRLLSLTRPGLSANFSYDAAGRRAGKTINGTTTRFQYDGLDVVREVVGGTSLHSLNGPGIDSTLQKNGQYVTPDHLGSAKYLTDSAGATTQIYGYKPFGESSQSTGVENPFQYTGRENDGTGLLYYRARYYAPEWGRFISHDPIGFAGGINPYAYVGNNPLSYTDPLDLWGVKIGRFNLGIGDPWLVFDRQTVHEGLMTAGAAMATNLGLYDGSGYRCKPGFAFSRISSGIGFASLGAASGGYVWARFGFSWMHLTPGILTIGGRNHFHVVYRAGERIAHGILPRTGNQAYVEPWDPRLVFRPWFSLPIPIRHPDAAMQTGQAVTNCVTAAFRAIWRGWGGR